MQAIGQGVKKQCRRKCKECLKIVRAAKVAKEKSLVDPLGLKVCRLCSESKTNSSFVVTSSGICHTCKSCSNEKALLVREQNPLSKSLVNINSRLNYLKNKDEVILRTSLYQKSNKDRSREYSKKSRRNNLHKDAEKSAKRRATKIRSVPKWACCKSARQEILAIYKECQRITKESGIEYNVDHLIPLQSEFVCGLHCAANLCIIPKTENSSKGNRHWPDMW